MMNTNTFPHDQEAGCCDAAIADHLPDACSNDIREQKLIRRQNKDGRGPIQRFVDREHILIIACVVIGVFMNFTEGQYVLYPFKIFSTWVHEMCHGLAAILTGGYIAKLNIFPDGSGLAYTATYSDWKRGFVASAGYPGTAVTGCLLLLFRRTTLGPTIGTIGLGVCMVLSAILWVRGLFGVLMISGGGLLLILLAWKLPAILLDHLYNFLAATCCLNAVESIHDLFSANGFMVNGESTSRTDAQSVAEIWGGDYRIWAGFWFGLSIAMTIVGIVFAFDAKETWCFKAKSYHHEPQEANVTAVDHDWVDTGYAFNELDYEAAQHPQSSSQGRNEFFNFSLFDKKKGQTRAQIY